MQIIMIIISSRIIIIIKIGIIIITILAILEFSIFLLILIIPSVLYKQTTQIHKINVMNTITIARI